MSLARQPVSFSLYGERRIMEQLLDFTAQTTIAASYGLFQILYTTAIRPQNWQGVAGGHNPHFLLNPQENAALSTGYLRRSFENANRSAAARNGVFASATQFRDVFFAAFNMYNHGGPRGIYGTEVLNFAALYPPRPSTTIFP
jgi:hypothetical protein